MTPSIKGFLIISITEMPIKYLRKIYTSTLNEQQQVEEVIVEFKQGLKKTEKNIGTREIQSMDVLIHAALSNNEAHYHIQPSRVQSGRVADTDNRAFEKMVWSLKSLSLPCMYTRSERLQLQHTKKCRKK